MQLYDTKSTLLLEHKLEKNGIDPFLLMLRAGKEIIKVCDTYKHKKIISIAGAGNNGGDALAATFFGVIKNKDIVSIDYTKRNKNSRRIKKFLRNINAIFLKNLPVLKTINKDYLIIDGILGIGINRAPEGNSLKAINWINKAKSKGATVISIDIPSGLNPNNGVTYKDSVKASSTVMCLTPKRGCYTGGGLIASGQLLYNDLGIDIKKYKIKSKTYLLNPEKKINLRRNKYGYKGTFGNALIIGGWDGMIGAANLSATAAIKTGAGKVYLCTNNPNKRINEIIHLEHTIKHLVKMLKKIKVVLAGPGLGENASELLEYIWNTDLPLVLDADALIWLSRNFKKKRRNLLICTPHYGEAEILLNNSFKDRFKAIKDLKEKYGGHWVLKGPGSLVLENKLYINNFANSILSTGGTGDVLSGIISGLVSQGIENPAKSGVSLHSKCAIEILNKKKKTIIASELINEISYAIN